MDAAPAATGCSMMYGKQAINSGHPCYLYLGDCKPGSMCTFDDGTQVPVGYQHVNGADYLLSIDNIPDCIGNCNRSLEYDNNVCVITQALDAKPYGQKIIENGVATYRCFCKCPDDNVEVAATHVCDVNSYGAPVHTGTKQCYVTGKNQIVSYGALKKDSYPWSQVKTATCKDNTYFSYDTLNERDTCKECPSFSTCPVDIENDPNGYQRFICNSNAYEYASDCYECGEHMTCDGGAEVECKSEERWYIQRNSSATPLRCDYCQIGWHCADQTGQNPEPNIHLYCLDGYRQVTSTAENAVTLDGTSYICETCSDYEICESGSLVGCNDGYWKSEDTCVACTGNAATCNADGAITCNAGYFPINKKCEECPDFATCKDDGTFTCDDGLHYKTDNGCDACPAGYATCSNDGFTCAADRYMMDGNSCPKCPDNATCTDNVGFTCNDGYWKSGDKCPQCTGAWVATCDANGIITCTDGHFPNNNKCQECPSNAECSDTEFVSCYTGFYGNQNGCQECPSPGTSLFNSNTSITDCYVPIWDGTQRITYTDSIGTFYFGIKSGQASSTNDKASHKTPD